MWWKLLLKVLWKFGPDLFRIALSIYDQVERIHKAKTGEEKARQWGIGMQRVGGYLPANREEELRELAWAWRNPEKTMNI